MPSTNGSDTESAPSSDGIKPDQESLKRDARAVADEAHSVTSEIRSEATAQIEQLAGQAKEQLSQATDKVRGVAGEQKDLLAAQMDGVADAMERVATDLESSNGASAQYVRIIADNAEKLSSSIRDNSVDELVSMAQDFGRRQPAAFIGAAALLGFAASRFLMASASRPAAQPASEQTDLGEDTQLPASQSDFLSADPDGGRI
jgi:hypothetical protein